MAVQDPEVGDVAPPIDLADGDGVRWRSRDHLGQPVVVVFHRHIH